MTPERWRQVKAIFNEAIDATGEERRKLVRDRCGDDAELRREVDALLGQSDTLGGFMEGGAASRAAELLAEQDSQTPPGSTLAEYVIRESLGRGGMGEVFLAEQETPRRDVALKIPHAGLGTSAARRLEHEASMLARLQHPSIAQVYGAGIGRVRYPDGGPGPLRPYFAMELVRGRPLSDVLRSRSLPIRDRFELFLQIADGVQHAHEKGVIHRDLKPSNVIVDPDSRVKILDFGIARLIGPEGDGTHTEAGELIGTLAYMSPEQVRGDAHAIDTRTDVYALGALLYEMLAGRPAQVVEGVPITEAARRITLDDPPRLGSIDPALRGDAEAIVAKAMEKDQARRYASAGAMADDVRRHLNHEPVQARRAGTLYYLRKYARRHRAAAGAIAGIALALVFGIVGTTWQAVAATRARNHAVDAEHRASRRFNQAWSLSRQLILELHPRIAPLAGSTPAREYLVAVGLETLDSLAADAGDDPAALRDLASAYRALGDVQGDPYNANLGDARGALESYEKARRYASRVLDTLTARPADFAEAMTIESHMGAVSNSLGNKPQALQHYRAALDIGHRRVDADPDDSIAASDLLVVYGRMIDLDAPQCDPDLHKRAYALCVHVQQRLNASENSSLELRRRQAQAAKVLGDCLCAMDRLEEALEVYEQCRDLDKLVADADPSNAQARSDLSIAHHLVGDTLARLERLDEAFPEYQAAVAIDQALSDIDPANIQAKRDLGDSLHKLADTHRRLGRPLESAQGFARAEAIHRGILAAQPGDLRATRKLAVALRGLGEARLQAAAEDSITPLRESVDLWREIRTRTPELSASVELASTLAALAQALAADPTLESESHAAARDARAILHELRARTQDKPDAQSIQAIEAVLATLPDP